MRSRNKFCFWAILCDVILIDQTLKYVAEIYLKCQNFTINKWFGFVLSHNTGCAWSFFQGQTEILGIFGLAVLFSAYFLRHSLKIYERPIVFSLLLGGILGNVIDRFCYGFVIDFIDINLQIYHWPTFNIADASMCVALFFILFFSPSKKLIEKISK